MKVCENADVDPATTVGIPGAGALTVTNKLINQLLNVRSERLSYQNTILALPTRRHDRLNFPLNAGQCCNTDGASSKRAT